MLRRGERSRKGAFLIYLGFKAAPGQVTENQRLLCPHLYKEREMDSVFTSLMLGAQTQLKFTVFSISQMSNFKCEAADHIVAAVYLHPQANSKNVLFMY